MSLRQAIRAERFRLVRDRANLFWGFGFVPLAYLTFVAAFTFMPMGRMGGTLLAVDPLLQAARAGAMGGNPVVHLFMAIGAAAIFGGEYRHSTWRLIGPRAPRHALLAAKYCGFVLAAGASLSLAMAGSFAIAWLPGLAGGARIEIALPLASVAAAFLVSLLELAAFGALVAVAAIATRSGVGAIFPPFFFSCGQALAEATWPPPASGGPWLALPTFAGDVVRRWAIPSQSMPSPTDGAVLLALASLAAWCVAGAALAALLLERQDWARE